MNNKVKLLGKRLYVPQLRDVAVPESVHSRSQFSLHLSIISPRKLAGKCTRNQKRDYTLSSAVTS